MMNNEREGVEKIYMIYHAKELPTIFKAITFAVTLISIFAIYYGLTRGFMALAWVGVMSLLVIAIDVQKAVVSCMKRKEGGAKTE